MSKSNLVYLFSAFIVGFCTMVVEITASRIVAPIVGSSIYTWSSIIGVILLGMILGNIIGGFFIDKYKSKNFVFVLFLFSSFFVATVPFFRDIFESFNYWSFGLAFSIVSVSCFLFLIPSFFLGTLYPAIFKFGLRDIENVGKISGIFSAMWSVGSIIGTFLAGFILVGSIGSSNTIYLVSTILFISGFIFWGFSKRNLITVILIVFAIFSGKFLVQDLSKRVIFAKESNYYDIKVVDYNSVYGKIRALFLDTDTHSIESLEGQKLKNYPEIYSIFGIFKNNIKSILNIGGGSYRMAKFFSDYYKDSNVLVAEIDPQVKKVAEDFFNLKKFNVDTEVIDGRVLLAKNSSKYDLIFGDAFSSLLSIPWHMATKEFNELVKSRLNDGGIYGINFISSLDGENSALFKNMLNTFKETFPNYYIFSFGDSSGSVQNIVLVGVNSSESITYDDLKAELEKLDDGNFLSGLLVDKYKISSDDGIIFTDDKADVGKSMASLIKNYFERYILIGCIMTGEKCAQ
jgi:spermidine synthase